MWGWDRYGVCECGYFQRTSFGSEFFWPETCPSCGEWPGGRFYKGAWRMVTGKRKGFFGTKLEIKGELSEKY